MTEVLPYVPNPNDGYDIEWTTIPLNTSRNYDGVSYCRWGDYVLAVGGIYHGFGSDKYPTTIRVFDLNNNCWTDAIEPEGMLAFSETTVWTIGNDLFIFGGYICMDGGKDMTNNKGVVVVDLITGKLRHGNAPRNLLPMVGMAVAVVDEMAYIFGGKRIDNSTFVSPLIQTFDSSGTHGYVDGVLTYAAFGMAAVATDKGIYVQGGFDGNGEPVANGCLFDPKAPSVSPLNENVDIMPARGNTALIAIEKTIFAIGGDTRSTGSNYESVAESFLYSSETSEWVFNGRLDSALGGVFATFNVDRQLFLFGGHVYDHTATSKPASVISVGTLTSKTSRWRDLKGKHTGTIDCVYFESGSNIVFGGGTDILDNVQSTRYVIDTTLDEVSEDSGDKFTVACNMIATDDSSTYLFNPIGDPTLANKISVMTKSPKAVVLSNGPVNITHGALINCAVPGGKGVAEVDGIIAYCGLIEDRLTSVISLTDKGGDVNDNYQQGVAMTKYVGAYKQGVQVDNDRLFLFGGATIDGNTVSNQGFFLSTSDFYTVTDLVIGSDYPSARRGHAMVRNGNFVYIIGGWGEDGVLLTTVHRYDIVANKWTLEREMPKGRAEMRAIVSNGDIYIFGGWTVGDEGEPVLSDTVQVYAPL